MTDYIFVIVYLVYFSNLQLIEGQLPDTESLRNVTHCDISSPLNIACGTDEVIAIHSIKLAYNVNCLTTCCYIYDSSDCLADFDADIIREFRRTCSGEQTCTVPSIQSTADFCSFGAMPVSYVFLQYYCIPESRTMTICDTGKITSDGPPLYITSANYPGVTIGSTLCACSIEVNSCLSSINLYEADIDLYLDTDNCLQNVVFKNGTDGVLTTIGCESYYTEYITSRAINSHYSKIDFINNSTANLEGLFLLGLKASEEGASFSLSCSSVAETLCIADCTANQCRCTNGDCIAGSRRCDNFPDCSDDSDEQNCACCGPVPVIPNGAAVLSANTTIANVVCHNGFQKSTSYITCLTSGDWEQATCTAVDCGPAPTVQSGNVTLDGTTTFGSTATVECETGYQPSKTKITCLASGQWEMPECKQKVSTTLANEVTPEEKNEIDIIPIIIIFILVFILIQISIVTFLQCKIYNIRKKVSDEEAEMPKRVLMIMAMCVPVLGFIAIYQSWRDIKEIHPQNSSGNSNIAINNNNDFKNVPPDIKSIPMKLVEGKDSINQNKLKHESSEIHGDIENPVHVDDIDIAENEGFSYSNGLVDNKAPHQDSAVSYPTYASAPSFQRRLKTDGISYSPWRNKPKKQGKHVEFVRDQLYINNCLYRPENHNHHHEQKTVNFY